MYLERDPEPQSFFISAETDESYYVWVTKDKDAFEDVTRILTMACCLTELNMQELVGDDEDFEETTKDALVATQPDSDHYQRYLYIPEYGFFEENHHALNNMNLERQI